MYLVGVGWGVEIYKNTSMKKINIYLFGVIIKG